jgi:hypothetical protein
MPDNGQYAVWLTTEGATHWDSKAWWIQTQKGGCFLPSPTLGPSWDGHWWDIGSASLRALGWACRANWASQPPSLHSRALASLLHTPTPASPGQTFVTPASMYIKVCIEYLIWPLGPCLLWLLLTLYPHSLYFLPLNLPYSKSLNPHTL